MWHTGAGNELQKAVDALGGILIPGRLQAHHLVRVRVRAWARARTRTGARTRTRVRARVRARA